MESLYDYILLDFEGNYYYKQCTKGELFKTIEASNGSIVKVERKQTLSTYEYGGILISEKATPELIYTQEHGLVEGVLF